MSTQKSRPAAGPLDPHTRRRRRSVGRKVGALAVATAIGLVACSGPGETPRAENVTTTGPAKASETAAEEVAKSFIKAYGAFDVEQANDYLAADADIADLWGSVGSPRVHGTLEGFRLFIAFLEAQGYKHKLDSCDETASSDAGTTLRCTFDFHAIRSDEIGLGPYSGSSFLLTVHGGEIVRASKTWGIEEFSPQMWEPFARWVSTAHPEDAAVMYGDESYSGVRLTEKSIRLWEKRSREYVDVKIAKMPDVEIAESFMEARNAYDAEKAMSLLASDGVRAPLMYDNAMDPNMPAVRLNRAELALAFEAERLYEMRYQRFECRPSGEAAHPGPRFDPGGGEITCTYVMDSRLREIEGYPPIERGFGLGFREGRINRLSFPWLNVSFPSYVPAEGGRFVQWLDRAHPEAGGPLDRGELFRTGGQELIHILTRESVDLLAGYLEEYERSRNG